MPEKEIILDLSKKIKLSNTIFVSIGSLLLSGIILLIQLLMFLSMNNWIWEPKAWLLLLNFFHSVRGGDIGNDNNSASGGTS